MTTQYKYQSEEEFLDKLRALAEKEKDHSKITAISPFWVEEVDHILKPKGDWLKFFTLTGAVLGFVLSFALMIYTVLDWPLITGGKPLISFPAFLIVAFPCTILLGGIFSFMGFLHLVKLPSVKRIVEPRDNEEQFVILVEEGE